MESKYHFYLYAHNVRFTAVAHPEVGIGSGSVVVQVGSVRERRWRQSLEEYLKCIGWALNSHVECPGIQHADVARTESVGQALELGQNPRLGHIQVGWDEHLAEVNLEGRIRSSSFGLISRRGQ